MPAFNVDKFRENIFQRGYAQTNKFGINIVPPRVMSGSYQPNKSAGSVSTTKTTELLTFRAESVKAPGVTLNLSDVYRHGIGIKQGMPFTAAFTDNAITFISDGRGEIWSFFYVWIKNIFQFSGNDNFLGNSINSLSSYELEYKDNYSTTIGISVYDNYGRVMQSINMQEAFPVSLNEVALGWGNNNQLLKVTVGLAFTNMTIEGAGYTGPAQTADFKLPQTSLTALATPPAVSTANRPENQII